MLISTKCFGQIELDDSKIITFDNGIMGFEDFKEYTILYDIDDEDKTAVISWLQSIEEPSLALPIINPFVLKEDYNPVLDDEMLEPLGALTQDNLVIFLTLTVPSDLTQMTANFKAPFIINADTKKGSQIIAENPDYDVKCNVYNIIQAKKDADAKKASEEKGEE